MILSCIQSPDEGLVCLHNNIATLICVRASGGGFVLPIFEGHVKFLGKTIEKVKESGGVDMNVAVLEYGEFLIEIILPST